MVDSRLRVNPPSLFHCFVYVSAPGQCDGNRIQKSLPEEFEEKELILKSIPDFCFPCAINYDGVQYSTFVLTDLDSKFRFGFCRYPPYAKHCLCIVSYFPWFRTFYNVLDKVAQINTKENNFKGITKFLEALNEEAIPAPGSKLFFNFNDGNTTQSFKVSIPDTSKLPSIPDNRNLTEYFAKVTPENMVNLFISMLFERRIIITSDKLSVLTAVVHGSVSLLYPMQWQHIYIPILPAHLIDYCCAPMPFLLGVHASMMEKVRNMPLSEVVIFDADQNEMYMIAEDLEIFPSRISSRLKRKLRHSDRALEDYVSRQFLYSLADLIGGYRDALKFLETDKGEKIVFDDQLFVNSRTGNTKVFLENILNLQSFRQFIAGRLEMLNDDQSLEDLFEKAINQRCLDAASETKYSQLKDKMKKGGGAIKKGGGAIKKGGAALKKSVDGSYSHLKVMAQDIDTKEFKKRIKDRVKDGYKGVMQITQKDHSGDDKEYSKGRSWSPNLRREKRKSLKHKSLLVKQVDNLDGQRLPPPRPPRPSSALFVKSTSHPSDRTSPYSTTELPRKAYAERERTASHSESDIASLVSAGIDSQREIIDDSSECSSFTFEAGLRAYSDTDSSTERLEGFQNPAFYDRNSDLLFCLSADEEDITFEQTPILSSKPYEKHTNRFISPLVTNEQFSKDTLHGKVVASCINTPEQEVTVKKFDNNIGPFYTPKCDFINRDQEKRKTLSSIVRTKPITGKKPIIPPRPQVSLDKSPPIPRSPDRPEVPSRPPLLITLAKNKTGTCNDEPSDLIFDSDSSENSALNKSFLADLTFEDPSWIQHRTSPISPLPSADLLGLEQSLFHETMQSVSDDTRLLMITSESTSPTRSNGTCVDTLQNYQRSKAFFEKDSYPNYNISNYSSISHPVNNGKVVNSTSSDLFANCFEDAKNIKYTPR